MFVSFLVIFTTQLAHPVKQELSGNIKWSPEDVRAAWTGYPEKSFTRFVTQCTQSVYIHAIFIDHSFTVCR